jgi:hypothetical protein
MGTKNIFCRLYSYFSDRISVSEFNIVLMKKMIKEYLKYKAIDFLKNESFLKNIILSTEEDILFWDDFIIKHPDKKKEIERAKSILFSMKFNNESFTLIEKNKLLEQIYLEIARQKHKIRVLSIQKWSVAACLALLIGFSCFYFFFQHNETVVADVPSVEISSDEKDIQLILADNEQLVFEKNADITYKEGGEVVVGSGNEEIATLNVEESESKYNKLIVPKGRRSSLVLEDGSRVWINSGTTLDFPVAFAANIREIHVDGEVYIEVAKDMQRPFVVRTSGWEVKALGTRFNASAYREDALQSVVLVEGLVEVQSHDKKKKETLLPDQMLSMNDKEMKISKVNAYDYISWKDGLLQFRSQPLSIILARLSRYYDVVIDCEPDIKEMKCTGKLVLFDKLQDVLETISNTVSLEKTAVSMIPVVYELSDNRVYIKKK